MAPRKPATGEKATRAKKATTTKKSADKVVKRPARGYHKFRNGLLNVTPKGGEKKMAESNQASPLLRLPAEIRNNIWKLVLGGKVFEPILEDTRRRYPTMSISLTDPNNAMALLRTCRQIYSEAASMPILLNTFSFSDLSCVRPALRKLQPYQRKQITSILLEISVRQDLDRLQYSGSRFAHAIPRFLPRLTKLIVCTFDVSIFESGDVREIKRTLCRQFQFCLPSLSVELDINLQKLEEEEEEIEDDEEEV